VSSQKNALSIAEMDKRYHLHPFSSVAAILQDGPLVLDKASGVYIDDDQGRRLLDGSAGLWCVNVGHGREEIISAVERQLRRLDYFQSFSGATNEPVAQLSARVLELAPAGMSRVFFGNSGSDAADSAVKMVTLYNNLRGNPKKKKFISRWRGYHGVTVAAGSLTGLESVHRLFDLPLPTVRHVDPPDSYHSPELTALDYAEKIDELIVEEGAETVAAFIAEPVMGTGGVLVPPEDYFTAIKKVLDKHDVLLVLDEVICGFGRLGRWFGAQRYGVVPDLFTTAKGLTSGYLPMSAVVVGEKIWSTFETERSKLGVFGHGFTSSGHPTVAACALANLDIIERENLVPRAGEMGDYLLSQLRASLSDHALVGDIRGCGLMVGLELVENKNARTNFAAEKGVAGKVLKAAIHEGLLVRALPANDVVALSPSFTITKQEIDALVDRLGAALDRVHHDLSSNI
jgi:L-2,4-diaminobutyrate transaminase